LPDTEYALNIFINVATDVTPFILLYNIHSRSQVESNLTINKKNGGILLRISKNTRSGGGRIINSVNKESDFFDAKHRSIKKINII
jgi:hypothetical protein